MLRKRIWIPIVCVFVIAMGCGLFYGRKVANQEPVKVYKPVEVSKQPVAPKPPPPGETYETGHWHGEESHAEPHDTPLIEDIPFEDADEHQPTRQSETDIASGNDVSTKGQSPEGRLTLGQVVAELGTDIYNIDLNEVPPDLRRKVQYFRDKKVWSEKWKKANTDWLEAGKNLDNIGPRDAEEYTKYIGSLSETEKLEHAARLKDALEKYRVASETLDAVSQEEPIYPNEEN
ncbi:MAG: hypothetical protein OXG97_15225 [Candidatus Poribacteria bacterium]|nr:hypothetical protein [Candidatus Poribacteria bacterium]